MNKRSPQYEEFRGNFMPITWTDWARRNKFVVKSSSKFGSNWNIKNWALFSSRCEFYWFLCHFNDCSNEIWYRQSVALSYSERIARGWLKTVSLYVHFVVCWWMVAWFCHQSHQTTEWKLLNKANSIQNLFSLENVYRKRNLDLIKFACTSVKITKIYQNFKLFPSSLKNFHSNLLDVVRLLTIAKNFCLQELTFINKSTTFAGLSLAVI